MKRWLFIGLLLVASTACAAPEGKIECKRLRVVLDARLSVETVEREWASGNARSEAPATLELVGCKGQVLDRLTLAAALAKLDPVPVRGAPYPTYLVSADLTADAGSYNGPLTMPVEVVNDHLVAAIARTADGRTEPIRLVSTGKAAWKRVLNRKSENLLSVSCQPRDQGFVTFYRRYVVSRHRWEAKTRNREEFWESDGKFPNRNLFP